MNKANKTYPKFIEGGICAYLSSLYPVDCGSVLYMYLINLFSMANLDAVRKDDVCGGLYRVTHTFQQKQYR